MGWGNEKLLPSGDLRKTLTYCPVGQFCFSKLKYAKMLNQSDPNMEITEPEVFNQPGSSQRNSSSDRHLSASSEKCLESVSQTGLSDKVAKLDSASGKDAPPIYQSKPNVEIAEAEVLHSLDTDCGDDHGNSSSDRHLSASDEKCLESVSHTGLSDNVAELDSASDKNAPPIYQSKPNMEIAEAEVLHSLDTDCGDVHGNSSSDRHLSASSEKCLESVSQTGLSDKVAKLVRWARMHHPFIKANPTWKSLKLKFCIVLTLTVVMTMGIPAQIDICQLLVV